MAIPDYESLILPVLRQVAEGREVHMSEMVAAIGALLSLKEEELREMLPSGVTTRFGNRVGWAKTYLKQAGLLEQPRRGVVRITDRGRQVLARNLSRVDNTVLAQFTEFENFRKRSRPAAPAPASAQQLRGETAPPAPAEPPMERLESAAKVGRSASKKGVFITTSTFTDQSRQFAARSLQQRIVLIDGERLAELMIEHDLGVSTAAIYRVKRVDSDYFVEE